MATAAETVMATSAEKLRPRRWMSERRSIVVKVRWVFTVVFMRRLAGSRRGSSSGWSDGGGASGDRYYQCEGYDYREEDGFRTVPRVAASLAKIRAPSHAASPEPRR